MDITVRYEKRMFRDWPADIRRKLKRITLYNVPDSGMKVSTRYDRNPLTCVAFNGTEILGWSLLVTNDKKMFGEYEKDMMMVYVKKAFRRQSIGTNLIKMVCNTGFKAVGWDSTSTRFWRKISKEEKIKVSYW